MTAAAPLSLRLDLPTAEATAELAERLAPVLRAGDVILLEGDIGAGKTHFCRALIQARLAAEGRAEDVPSPTFTLVQVYEAAGTEVWHADLYRLGGPSEVAELGLEEAFGAAICLVEWPDRLAGLTPANALHLGLTVAADDSRVARFRAADGRWAQVAQVLISAGARHG